MPTINLDNTITLSLSVKDRAQSVAWYGKHLGFKHLYDADEMGWSEMATHTEGVTIGLGDMDEVQAGNCVPVFGVADLDSARKALEAESVRFDGDTIHEEGMVKIATFYDPDGNALMIAEDLSQP
ncbi:MAG: VOC family protein [Pseudomonadota bacterium]